MTEQELKELYAGVYEMSVSRPPSFSFITSDFTYEVETADFKQVIPVNCVKLCATRGFKYGKPDLIAMLGDVVRQVAFLQLEVICSK